MDSIMKQAWQEASAEVSEEMWPKTVRTRSIRYLPKLDAFALQDIKDHPTYSRL